MAQKAQEESWELYYWGSEVVGGPGRAGFVRLVLEEANVPYEMKHDGCFELFKGGKWDGYPTLAVPLLNRGNFSLSQTGVICRYLGKKYGLYPTSEVDEWHADQLNTTIHDYLGEGRLSFHGKNWTASFFTQQEETQPYICFFINERMPKFLGHFEKALAYNNGGEGFLVGDKLTYVDLALLHALRATESQFPEAWNKLTTIPLLKAFKTRLSERPRIKAFLESDRCPAFSGNSMM